MTRTEAHQLLWHACEALHRMGKPASRLADDVEMAYTRLKSDRWEQWPNGLEEYAYSFIPRGRRGRVTVVLESALWVKVHGFIRAVLLAVQL